MTHVGPKPDTLPEAPFPVRNGKDYRIVMDEEPYRALVEHAREDMSVELCGVLLGGPARDSQGPFLHIRHIIRGEKAASAGAQVTFTHQTWEIINREKDSRYADERIVGWYHTHPGFGVFLSGMDEFIHQSTFNDPSYVAFVLDPKTGDEGFFAWRGDKTVLMRHFWVGAEPRFSSPPPPPKPAELKTEAPEPEQKEPSDLLDFRFLLVPRYWVTVVLWAAISVGVYWLMASCAGSPGEYSARVEEERVAILRQLVRETFLDRAPSGQPNRDRILEELDITTLKVAREHLRHRPVFKAEQRTAEREALRPAAGMVFLWMSERRVAAAAKADDPEPLLREARYWRKIAFELAPELEAKKEDQKDNKKKELNGTGPKD